MQSASGVLVGLMQRDAAVDKIADIDSKYVCIWQIWVLIKRGTDDRAESGMEREIRKILHQVNRLKCIDWTDRFTLYD